MSLRLKTASLACPVLVSAVSAACYSTGAKAIRSGRGNYNIAIQQTNAQQLLLNIVRLRCRDTPTFLIVSSVSSSFTFGVDAEAGVADLDDLGVVGVSGGLSYAEKPTVTYSPLQGQQFVNKLLTPMSLRVPLLLYHSGWRIDRVLKVCLQTIGLHTALPAVSRPDRAGTGGRRRKGHRVADRFASCRLSRSPGAEARARRAGRHRANHAHDRSEEGTRNHSRGDAFCVGRDVLPFIGSRAPAEGRECGTGDRHRR